MTFYESEFTVDPEKGLYYADRQITNFIVEIRGAYWRLGSRPPQAPYMIRIRIVLPGAASKPEFYYTYEELIKLDFVKVFPGCRYLDEGKQKQSLKLLREYIIERICMIGDSDQYGVLYEKTGWHWDPRGSRFVVGGEILGECFEPHAFSKEIKSYRLVADDQTADVKAAEDMLLLLQRQPDVMIPVYAFTLFSSLRSIFCEEHIPMSCVLNVQGQQGFGKTTIVKHLCLLYDDSAGRTIDMLDAISTDTAIRDVLASARDRIVLLDDVCQSTNLEMQKKRQKTAATAIRMAANETSAAHKLGKQTVSVESKASLVVTGEIPFEVSSDLTRCVTVELQKPMTGGSDDDRRVAATALLAYLCWFAAHADDERDRLRKDYADFKAKSRSGGQERLQTSLWELSWAFESFLRFAKDVDAISDRAVMKYAELLNMILQNIFSRTKERVDRLEKKSLSNLPGAIRAGVQLGYFEFIDHNGCICVRSEKLTQYLRKYSERTDLSVNDVTAALRVHNLLRTDASNDATCKVKGTRMLCIPKSKIFSNTGCR